VKLIGDEATLHASNVHLRKTIKQYDVFSIDEEWKMFLQPIYELTSPTFNTRFGYFCIQIFFKGCSKFKNVDFEGFFLFRCLQG
jgi:hypothetical protein